MRDAQQELDDEILSACHDGELPTTEADAVRRRLAREPELADRLHAIQSVDAATVGAFRAQDGHALPERVLELLAAGQSRSYDEYETLLDDDVARELARINLPLSLYTEMYWQCDLNNLFHFLRLRLDWHAQYEIRAYGDAVATAVKAVSPLAYEAFEEHVLHGRSFSRTELHALVSALDMAELSKALAESGLRKTRRAELLAKLGLSPGDLPDAEVATATPRRGGTPQES